MKKDFDIDWSTFAGQTGKDLRNSDNRQGKAVDSAPTGGTGDRLNLTQNITSALKMTFEEGQNYIILQWTGNAGGANLYGKTSDHAPSLVITTANASATTSYTVRFVDATSGNELKEPVIHEGALIGSSASASDDEKKAFKNDSNTKKYIYVTEGSTSEIANLVSNSESNIITLKFREAETWTYTLNAIYGETLLGTLETGSVFEGDSKYVTARNYYLSESTLVQASFSDRSYNTEIKPTENNYVKTINYTATDKTNVVFFSEAEDIVSLTPITSNYLPERFSGGKGAYAAESDKVITTLQPGKYRLAAHVMGTQSACTFTFKAGEQTVWERTTDSGSFYKGDGNIGDEFTITEATDIVLVAGGGDGSNNKVTNAVDFIYIQKTGESIITATTGEAGWISFSSAYNLTIPEGMRAYTATISGDAVTATEISESVIPANTGVLLRANSGEYTLTVATDATALTEENELEATGVDGKDVAANSYYGLAIVDATNKQVGFAPISAGKVGANKAILPANAAVKGRALPLVVDGQATGIWFVGNDAVSTDGPAYNLAGQRVADGYKGIVIRNGKKFLVK